MGQEEYHRIKKRLKKENVDFEILNHKPVYTSKEAADIRDVKLKTGVKAMVFKTKEEFIMALIPADKRVNVNKLKKVNSSEIKLASPNEVLKRTNCKVGSVPPFGFKKRLKTFMDKDILENKEVNFNIGLHTKSVKMKSGDLRNIIKPKICNIT